MKIKAFGKRLGLDEDETWEKLVELGIIKQNGTPKKKFITNGYFNDEGDVLDAKGLAEVIEELDEPEEEEEPPKKKPSKSKKVEEDDDDDDDDEVSFEDKDVSPKDIRDALKNMRFESTSEIKELINVLMVRLENSSNDIEDDDDDDDEDDHNKDGSKYRGWTISNNGKKVIATKKNRSLNCKPNEDIWDVIDEEEED